MKSATIHFFRYEYTNNSAYKSKYNENKNDAIREQSK